MDRTFNCGIGMVAVVAEPDAARAIGSLSRSGETAWWIGTVVPFTQGHGERVVIEGLATRLIEGPTDMRSDRWTYAGVPSRGRRLGDVPEGYQATL